VIIKFVFKIELFPPPSPPKGEIFAARKDACIYISPLEGAKGGKCAITAKCYNQGRTHQNILSRWDNKNEVLVMFYQYFIFTEALITFKMFP